NLQLAVSFLSPHIFRWPSAPRSELGHSNPRYAEAPVPSFGKSVAFAGGAMHAAAPRTKVDIYKKFSQEHDDLLDSSTARRRAQGSLRPTPCDVRFDVEGVTGRSVQN